MVLLLRDARDFERRSCEKPSTDGREEVSLALCSSNTASYTGYVNLDRSFYFSSELGRRWQVKSRFCLLWFVLQQSCPDIKCEFYELLHQLLLHNWRFFFRSSLLAKMSAGEDTVENQPQFITIMQASEVIVDSKRVSHKLAMLVFLSNLVLFLIEDALKSPWVFQRYVYISPKWDVSLRVLICYKRAFFSTLKGQTYGISAPQRELREKAGHRNYFVFHFFKEFLQRNWEFNVMSTIVISVVQLHSFLLEC